MFTVYNEDLVLHLEADFTCAALVDPVNLLRPLKSVC